VGLLVQRLHELSFVQTVLEESAYVRHLSKEVVPDLSQCATVPPSPKQAFYEIYQGRPLEPRED
jgi:hypothetical protein